MTRRKKATLGQPAPKQPAPKQPAPKQPAPKQPAPKQPAPKQPAPKQPAPKQPAPKQPAPNKRPHTPPAISNNTSIARVFDPLFFVTKEELLDIDTQFAVSLKGVDVVLFWTGVEWAHVQKWAKIWRLKTLTIAMGQLMDPANANSPKARKGKQAYSRYVKGASGRFAQYACEHCRVIVLTNPPPNICSSRENNTYQQLEEPILKGLFGGIPVRRIDYLHPTVDGAAHVTYQAWPYNKTQDWAIPFGARYIRSWKKLNWSYKSLVTTSQLSLKTLWNQVLPVAATPHVLPAQSSCGQDRMTQNHLPDPKYLPELTVDDRNIHLPIVNNRNLAALEQDVELVEEGRPAAGFGIRGHESRMPILGSRPVGLISSTGHLVDKQFYNREEQRSHFHVQGLVKEPVGPSGTGYAIHKCTVVSRQFFVSTVIEQGSIAN